MKIILCLLWFWAVNAFRYKPLYANKFQLLASNDVGTVSDDERRKLWKFVSSLEKEAIETISKNNVSDEDINKAIQLFAMSIRSKNSDPFIQLTHQYLNAVDTGDKDEINRILKVVKEIGFPPHIQEIVIKNRGSQSVPSFVKSGDSSVGLYEEMEVVDPGSMFSDTVTEKVRVKIHSYYDNVKSQPSQGKFMFWYKVAIFNEGTEPVQIVSRMWEIEKCRGSKEVVRGVGIIGTQPIIPPGEVFTYKSVCPIKVFPPRGKRVIGSMSGVYTLCKGNLGQQNFNVKVGKFSFILPEDISNSLT